MTDKKVFTINEKFEFLDNMTTMVVEGEIPSVVVMGDPGLGKTHSVIECINSNNLSENDYIFIKGHSTARGLYNTLYDNNGKLIIFDDCDSVLEDKVSLNILKSALDSYDKRTISWMSKMNKNDEYPNRFDFTGRIVFISNKTRDKMNTAVLSRGLCVDLSMSPSEKIERMRFVSDKILPEYNMDFKLDALDFMEEVKEEVELNFRTFIMISKIRKSFPDKWENISRYMVSTNS